MSVIKIPFIKNDKIIDNSSYKYVEDCDFNYLYEYIHEKHKTTIFIGNNTPVLYQRITKPINNQYLYYNEYNKYKTIYSRVVGIDMLIKDAINFKNRFYSSYLIIDILNILRPNIRLINSNISKNINISYKDARMELICIKDKVINSLNLVHSNILLFDLVNRTVERFDPHGHGGDIEIDEFDAILNRELYKNKFRYLRPIDYCPKLSFQSILSTTNNPKYKDLGFCTPWNLFYLECRLLNPNISRDVLCVKLISYFKRTYGSISEKRMFTTIYNYSMILDRYIDFRKNGFTPINAIDKIKKLGFFKKEFSLFSLVFGF